MNPVAPLRYASHVLLAALSVAACSPDTRTPGGETPPAATAEDGGGHDIAAAVAAAGCPAGDPACADVERLEEVLARYEAGVAYVIDEAAAGCWRADQDAFRRTLAACSDAACRSRSLLQRVASLDYMQPQVSRTNEDLPAGPSLIAILGPDPDAPDASDDAAQPFEARGTLVHASEHPEHMGLAVQTSQGNQHVVLFDMFIGAGTGQRDVLGLAEARSPRQVHVTGFGAPASTGVPNFDTNRCRWVYLLP